MKSKRDGWSADEEREVIAAYRRLWIDQRRGASVDIPATIAELRRVAKEPGAIRMRMSNISAVLDERGIRSVVGLSPLRNYAKQTKLLVDQSLPWE